ncbi:unnamed protein product, partial [Symbiodinium natans]
DVVFAPWAEDGFDYEATIDHIDEASECCTVSWADGGQTCREVRLPALISPLGSPCVNALRRRPQEVRLWASRRALRAALLAWQAQAEAGAAHDAFVDLAGLLCDVSAAECRLALAVPFWSSPGLELARNALQRGRFAAERAYKPDARALAVLCSQRAEMLRLEQGSQLADVLSLHGRAAEHLAAAHWRREQ